MKLLVTGATGYIGRTLVNSLLEKREAEPPEITALVRDSAGVRECGPIHPVEGELATLAEGAFHGRRFDVAVNLAALMADRDCLPRSEFERVNVEGTRRLILSLRECRLKQFIHISTVGVYGPTGPVPAREEDGYGERLSDYEWSKMEAEKVAVDCCRRIGVPLTILRLGLMYGEGMTYGWPSTVEAIRRGKMRIIGNGSALIQLSYIRDVVEGITLAIGNPRAYDSAFNICGGEVMTVAGVFHTIADLLGVPRPGTVPFAPVYLLSHLLSLVPDALKGPSLRLVTPHRVRFFREHRVYDIGKAESILHFHPRYGVKEGMRNMILAGQAE